MNEIHKIIVASFHFGRLIAKSFQRACNFTYKTDSARRVRYLKTMSEMERSTTTEEVADEKRTIGSYAVLDIETSNLPAYNNNRVGITELSIYAFAAAEMEKQTQVVPLDEGMEGIGALPPETPRVLHKLTLLMNPRMTIAPAAEKITGLDNYMLEYESSFDENAAETILGFIRRLQQPVCLVAHNGWGFDFPIVKEKLERLDKRMPIGTLCVDSLRAFLEIDDARWRERSKVLLNPPSPPSPAEATGETVAPESPTSALSANAKIDWRAHNELTPKAPVLSASAAGVKRKLLADVAVEAVDVTPIDQPQTDAEDSLAASPPKRRQTAARRVLFSPAAAGTHHEIKRFPPKFMYRLDRIYERTFGQPPSQAHFAEADVESLTRLMLHYGPDFVAYALEQAVPFEQVRRVNQRF